MNYGDHINDRLPIKVPSTKKDLTKLLEIESP